MKLCVLVGKGREEEGVAGLNFFLNIYIYTWILKSLRMGC